jgi:hypothetical protein
MIWGRMTVYGRAQAGRVSESDLMSAGLRAESKGEPAVLATLRRLLLAVVLVGIVGLAAELVLLEHYEGVWQWVPLVLLGTGLVTGALVGVRARRPVLVAFRGVMVLFVAAGALGVYFHQRGNAEFERESDSTLRGVALLWESLRGATPSLAPGSLAQLGLLGLALTFAHPAFRRDEARG